MKKILIVLSALVLTSCGEGYVDVYKKGKLDSDSQPIRRSEVPFNEITHFEYCGHSYIKFASRFGNGAEAGVVHDPDCKCKEDAE